MRGEDDVLNELDENAIDELEDGAEGTAEIESVEEVENAEGDEE